MSEHHKNHATFTDVVMIRSCRRGLTIQITNPPFLYLAFYETSLHEEQHTHPYHIVNQQLMLIILLVFQLQ